MPAYMITVRIAESKSNHPWVGCPFRSCNEHLFPFGAWVIARETHEILLSPWKHIPLLILRSMNALETALPYLCPGKPYE